MKSMESGRWYTREGKPQHTQPTAKGAKNKTRATTIADARKLDLLPSVSSITKVLSAPGLEHYKSKELAKACFNSPAIGEEDFDTYYKHVSEVASRDVTNASEIGTIIHKALETYYSEPLIYRPHDILVNDQAVSSGEFIVPVHNAISALNIEIMHSEKVIVNNAYGYAGTTDIIFRSKDKFGIADFKTTKTKPGKAKEPNESHPLQIAAYIAAFWGDDMFSENIRGYNIYISTTEIGRVDVKEWTADEINAAWDMFQNCLSIWRWRNNYDPRQK